MAAAVLPNGIESTEELLDAQCHIYKHTFSFINSMSLKCAVELRIPDIIHNHNKPIKLSELAEALSINEAKKTACLGRLMRLLIHSNFFTMAKIEDEEEEEGYWLTPASRLLRRDEALGPAPFVLCMLDPKMMDPGHSMGEWLRDDGAAVTAFATSHGRAYWDVIGGDARMNKALNEGMSCDTGLLMSVIVKDVRHVFEELESMVDVGGGTGTMARAIANAFPGIKCTVLDLPHVLKGLMQDTPNLKFIEGDMFKAIPNAQAVSFKYVLHDWSDEECIQILSKCKEAIPCKENGGKVIIIDIVVGNNIKAMETQLLLDIAMMIWVTGKERNEQEWANIFHAAGFTSYKITPILGIRSLIEVFP